MKIKDIFAYLNAQAPFETAQKWDNSGLLLGDMEAACDRVLLALDITRDVVDQAKACGANLVITHHPVIFHPLSSLSYHAPLATLVRENIAVLSAHTNLDIADGGVNDCLCQALGLNNVSVVPSYEGPFLKIGALPEPMSAQAFARCVATVLSSNCTTVNTCERTVSRVAVCSGAGGAFAGDVMACGADAFVTGEMKYNELLELTDAGVVIVQAGHRETERLYAPALAEKLKREFPSVTFTIAEEHNLMTGVYHGI